MKNTIYTKISEFVDNTKYDQSLTDDELFEMSNYWGSDLGLDENIVIWIGSVLSSQHQYGNRIKVSNIPGKGPGSSKDCFTITIPKLEVIGYVNKKHITSKKLNTIFGFIKLNMDLIIAYCQEEISGMEFSKNVEKYREI